MMLKEERDARDFIRAAIQNDCDKPRATALITALVRAVRLQEREQCAKVAEAAKQVATHDDFSAAMDELRAALDALKEGK